MSLSNNQFEFLKDLATFIDYLVNVKKLKITATWLHRPQEVQKVLYEQGLSKTLESNHLYHTLSLFCEFHRVFLLYSRNFQNEYHQYYDS